MSASDPFESPKALIRWARSDLDDLKAEVSAYFARHPYVIFNEVDPDTGDNLRKLRLTDRLSDRSHKLANSVVHNARHALDQSLHAAIEIIEGKARRKDEYFPFRTDPTDLEHWIRHHDAPAVLADILRKSEPYPRGDGYPGGDSTFRLLGKMAGPSKHRISLRVEIQPRHASLFTFGAAPLGSRLPEMPMTFDSEKQEWTILRSNPNHVFFDVGQIAPDIAFLDAEDPTPISVIGLLTHAVDKVTGVVDAFEAECVRVLQSRN